MIPLRKLDCHTHFVGGGTSNTGSWFRLRTHWDKFQAKMLLKSCGIKKESMYGDLDNLYMNQLLKFVQKSSIDAIVLLAQDIAHTENGTPLPEKSKFYVPNNIVLDLAKKHKEIIPAVSIHPARKDAMEELETCIQAGAKILKLLPNVIDVNCSDCKYREFWLRMAESGMILLSHTGGEMTLPVINKSYANPQILELPLKCGVRCIAAHCAGGSFPGDRDYTQDLIKMFDQYPGLYGDNSALCSLNRNRALKEILPKKVQSRIIHGSDYPVPVSGLGPFLRGVLPWKAWQKYKYCSNPIERDYKYKKAMGFLEETFTRMDRLLKQ